MLRFHLFVSLLLVASAASAGPNYYSPCVNCTPADMVWMAEKFGPGEHLLIDPVAQRGRIYQVRCGAAPKSPGRFRLVAWQTCGATEQAWSPKDQRRIEMILPGIDLDGRWKRSVSVQLPDESLAEQVQQRGQELYRVKDRLRRQLLDVADDASDWALLLPWLERYIGLAISADLDIVAHFSDGQLRANTGLDLSGGPPMTIRYFKFDRSSAQDLHGTPFSGLDDIAEQPVDAPRDSGKPGIFVLCAGCSEPAMIGAAVARGVGEHLVLNKLENRGLRVSVSCATVAHSGAAETAASHCISDATQWTEADQRTIDFITERSVFNATWSIGLELMADLSVYELAMNAPERLPELRRAVAQQVWSEPALAPHWSMLANWTQRFKRFGQTGSAFVRIRLVDGSTEATVNLELLDGSLDSIVDGVQIHRDTTRDSYGNLVSGLSLTEVLRRPGWRFDFAGEADAPVGWRSLMIAQGFAVDSETGSKWLCTLKKTAGLEMKDWPRYCAPEPSQARQ